MTAATNREKAMSAYRQRFAHLISVRRIDSMSSCRSTSGFEDSQSSGARSGDKRMKAPATQKRGNTRRRQFRIGIYPMMIPGVLTKAKFEEVHGQGGLAGHLRVCRGFEGILVGWREGLWLDQGSLTGFVVSAVPGAGEAKGSARTRVGDTKEGVNGVDRILRGAAGARSIGASGRGRRDGSLGLKVAFGGGGAVEETEDGRARSGGGGGGGRHRKIAGGGGGSSARRGLEKA